MPPLPSPGQVVKFQFNYGNDDALATNIMYYSYSGAGALSLSELTAFGDSNAQIIDLPAPYTGASLAASHGLESHYTDLSSDIGVTYSYTYTWVGTNTGSPMPANAAVVVSHEIARRYRGGHPRNYMMVGSASDYLSGSIKFWQAAFLTNISNGWEDYLADFPLTIGSRTWNPVNVSYYETVGGVRQLRATPLVDLIFQHVVRDRVCSQRRRLGKVGG